MKKVEKSDFFLLFPIAHVKREKVRFTELSQSHQSFVKQSFVCEFCKIMLLFWSVGHLNHPLPQFLKIKIKIFRKKRRNLGENSGPSRENICVDYLATLVDAVWKRVRSVHVNELSSRRRRMFNFYQN